MAKNEGLSALGGFGEAFFKTIQSERERQDKLNQQQQEFSQRSREMNLLNAYRNKMYELEANKPFETKSGDIYPSENGVPNFDKPTWQMPQQEAEPKPFDIEGSYKNDETGTYWTYNKQTGKPEDLGIPFDRNEGRSTTTNINTPQEETTPYINFDSVDEMVRNYNKRDGDTVAIDSSTGTVDQWRIKANEKLEANLKAAGISQEVSDKIWELAGITDGDTAVQKRNKLKNVLDQQPQLPSHQKRALYQMVEVRTR